MVTLRHCSEKEQLVELYIKVPIIVSDGVSGPLFFLFFLFFVLALFISSNSELVEKRDKPYLKLESSLILSYPSS